MAKYVMIAFEKDELADAFVQSFEDGTVFFEAKNPNGNGGVYGYIDSVVNKIRGIWKKPTSYCECGIQRGKLVHGVKHGWFVCSKCGKAEKDWYRGGGWYAMLGRNLLPVSDVAPEWRGDKVPPQHYFDAERKLWVSVHTGEALNGQLPDPPEKFAHLYVRTSAQ